MMNFFQMRLLMLTQCLNLNHGFGLVTRLSRLDEIDV